MSMKKYIKYLGYEYICAMLQDYRENSPYYKLLTKRKRQLERQAKRRLPF